MWREYLKETTKGDTLLDFNFRDKKDGWLDFQCVTTTTTTTTRREQQMANVFFRGFLKNIYLRESCYQCAFKMVHRSADITLADFWGVQDVCPQMDDNKGTSLVFCHSSRGLWVMQALAPYFSICVQPIDEAVVHNKSMVESVAMHSRRRDFLMVFRHTHSFRYAARLIDKDRLSKRIVRRIMRILHLKNE